MIALVPLRLVLGAIFVVHGYLKLFSRSYGPAQFRKYLAGEKVPFPTQTGLAIGVLEFAAGFCLLAGVYARVAAALLAIHVLLALVIVAPKKGFTKLPDGTGWEYELLLLVALLTILLSAPAPHASNLLLGR